MRVYDFISGRIVWQLHFHLHLAINPIYTRLRDLARVLNSSRTAIKLAGDRWAPVEASIIEQMGGQQTWQMTE
jgi:hypothetical protein